MIIKSINIKNFKSLEDFTFEPKPITLLFGNNSSGKSSIMKSLLFLRKNAFPVTQNYKNFHNGQLVYKITDDIDLRNYKETVNNSDTSKIIKYEFNLDFDFNFPTSLRKDPGFNFGGDKLINERKYSCKVNVIFEFSCQQNKERLSKIVFKDLINSKSLTFNIKDDGYSDMDYEGDFRGFQYLVFGDYVKDQSGNINMYNYTQNVHNIPFSSFDKKGFNDKYLKAKSLLKKSTQKNNGSINPALSQIELLNGLKEYYLYYYLIPSYIAAYLSGLHFSQVRKLPLHSYDNQGIDIDDKGYYGMLNILYRHQNGVLNYFKKTKAVLIKSDFQHYYKKLESLILLLNKFDRKRIRNIFFIIHYDLKGNAKSADGLYKFYSGLKKEKKLKPFYTRKDIKTLFNICKNDSKIGGFYDYTSFGDDSQPYLLRNVFISINQMLHHMGFDGFLFVIKNEDHTKLVIVKKDGTSYNFANESSGLLQILPILIGLSLFKEYQFDVGEDSFRFPLYDDYTDLISNAVDCTNFLYVEQPELHLHPGLQSKFIEILLKEIKQFSNYNSIIIETHSEHILKKMQLEIAKGNLSSDDIQIYFISKEKFHSHGEKIGVSSKGLLQNDFPNGFFDTTLDLTIDIFKTLATK